MKKSQSLAYVLIGIGSILLLERIFNFNISLWGVAFSLMFIYIGYKLLTGQTIDFNGQNDDNLMFASASSYAVNKDRNYNVMFGSRRVYLSSIDKGDLMLGFNVLFGSIQVYVPRRLSLEISASSAFGNIQFPDLSQVTFGEKVVKHQGQTVQTVVFCKAGVVFGEIEFILTD
jgi:predicted membrane protein